VRRTVALLHDVREDANLSMKLYAERVAAAVGGGWMVRHVSPWAGWGNAPGGRGTFSWWLAKSGEYVARYLVYPVAAARRRADVFHIVDHGYGYLLASVPGRRTVVTCHDLMLLKLARGEFGWRGPIPKLPALLLRLSAGFLRLAGRVVAVSRATADDTVRLLGVPRERVEVIYSGVEASFSPPPDRATRRAARARLGLDGRPVLLHVGNNWFYKNVDAVIRTLPLVGNGDAAVLLKVGQGFSVDQQALAARLAVTDRIRELGRLGVDELRAVYWAADVLVFPSLWEGFGWPVLEAMACGTPVVCSDRGALGETAPGAATLVDPDDPKGIADAIMRVLTDSSYRRTQVEAGLDRAREFTWERAGKQLCAVYESVAEDAP